jgi:hypothetical protein
MEALFYHEYVLAMYGVLLWQLEQFFTSNKGFVEFVKYSYKTIGRSFVWIGILIVFDDELLLQYNQWAEMDYAATQPWMYIAVGFFVDFIRTKIINYANKASENHEVI